MFLATKNHREESVEWGVGCCDLQHPAGLFVVLDRFFEDLGCRFFVFES